MLAINGIPMSESKERELRTHINKALDALKAKKNVTIDFHKSKIRPLVIGEGSNTRETSAGITGDPWGNYMFEDNEYTIQWFRNYTVGKNDEKTFTPHSYSFTGARTFVAGKDDFTELFFMTCVLKICAVTGFIKKYQSNQDDSGQLYYRIVDATIDATAENEISRKKAAVTRAIFDDVHGLSSTDVKTVAIGLGVVTNLKEDTEVVRNLLNRYVHSGPNGAFVPEKANLLIDTIKKETDATTRATVKTAIAKKLILLGETSNKRVSWYYPDKKGEQGKHLLTVKNKLEAEDQLILHLLSKKIHREFFFSYVESDGKSFGSKDEKEDGFMIENLNKV